MNHFAIVGQTASSWAGFELTLDLAILALGQIAEEPGLCLTAQIAGPARKFGCSYRPGAAAGRRGVHEGTRGVRKGHTTSLAERRNRVVHNPWVILALGSPHRSETTARRKLRHQYVEVTLQEISKLVQDITAHHQRFRSLDDEIVQAAVDT
jgi:hypothetical protein